MIAKPSSKSLTPRAALFLGFAVAAGCVPVRPPTAPEAPIARYEAVTEHDAATVAALRAAPPPASAEISNGGKPSADEQLLNARGYVRIGNGFIPPRAGDPRAWAEQQGQVVGADKILMYEPAADGDGTTQAAFYVHYRLPFGATFRSLTADEQRTLGSGGVQLGEVVGGTPASEANLQRGDFVVKFNGKPFADRAAFQQLLRENLGKRVTLTVSRNGVPLERLVRLGGAARSDAKQ